QARLMDAVRIHDGQRVVIKRVDLSRGIRHHEWNINKIFAPDEVAHNPRNHCIRLLDYLRYPGTNWELLVMPQMLLFDVTPFETVDEVLQFVMQILEGVAFMHELNVAHRDIGPFNIVMYSPDLFPDGTNYLVPGYQTDLSSDPSVFRARRQVYVRYFLIDFGLSWAFPDAGSRHHLPIVRGQLKDVPEYATSQVCDGFALDVWCIGRLIETEFMDVSQPHKSVASNATYFLTPGFPCRSIVFQSISASLRPG
ncbi:kinase-like protein, partial [Auricularia subglabra TFB-10046 SS5]